jgi:altronate dehydratase
MTPIGDITVRPSNTLKGDGGFLIKVIVMAGTRRYVVVDERDNVATVVETLRKGEVLETRAGMIKLLRDIPEGHKFALTKIPRGAYVVKYGEWIGRATTDIPAGDHTHVHNVEDIVDEVRKL